MQPRTLSTLFVLTLLALLSLPVRGQQSDSPASAVLKVEGEVQKSLSLSRADLDKMPQVAVRGKDHDGREHVYKGVPVADLLRQAGATLGGQLRGKNLAQYLLAQAKDGNPIPDAEGPFRIVVPGEKKQARWVRQVSTLKVLKAAQAASQ